MCSYSVIYSLADVTEPTLYFGVKFYAADPCKLQEEITRWVTEIRVPNNI